MKVIHSVPAFILFTLSLCVACGCGEEEEQPRADNESSPCIFLGVDTCQQNEKNRLVIDLQTTRQTIHSFGASDCWTAKFIGTWADAGKKNRIADLLFSTDTLDDGSPEGIGLTLWRFNIGSGSYEQGDTSNIATDWRREECFQNADGSYDWSKQAGQQWFLEAARARGVPYTLGFSLSPPVHMTLNGKAFNGTTSTNLNIQDGKLDDYAGFMVAVSEHFGFDYLSPVNEPQWQWGKNGTSSQAGTQATNVEIAQLTKLLSAKFPDNSKTEVVVGEAGTLEFLYGKNTDGRGDQISQFFSPSSANYIGGLPHVAHIISGHSYFTTCPGNTLLNVRQQVAGKVTQTDADLGFWQTEFGILGDICGQYNGSPRNTNIDYGLYIAKVLHHDLSVANATSWQWWLAMSPYNYSDALVYINDPSGNINVDNCKADGIVLDSKQLWVYGNYARFIRPGMKRVAASIAGYEDAVTSANTMMVSAYKDEAAHKVVVVIVNVDSDEHVLKLDDTLKIKGNTFAAYTTNATQNLRKSTVGADDIRIKGRSVVTLEGIYL